jgi:hypothetical protein
MTPAKGKDHEGKNRLLGRLGQEKTDGKDHWGKNLFPAFSPVVFSVSFLLTESTKPPCGGSVVAVLGGVDPSLVDHSLAVLTVALGDVIESAHTCWPLAPFLGRPFLVSVNPSQHGEPRCAGAGCESSD